MNENKFLKFEDGDKSPKYYDDPSIPMGLEIPKTSTININETNKVIKNTLIKDSEIAKENKNINKISFLNSEDIKKNIIKEYRKEINEDIKRSNEFKKMMEEEKFYKESQSLPKWGKYLEYLETTPEENINPLIFEKSLKGKLMYIWNLIRFKGESNWQKITQIEIQKEFDKRNKIKELALQERLEYVKKKTAYIDEETKKRIDEVENDPSIESFYNNEDIDTIVKKRVKEYNLIRNPPKENLRNN